MIPLTILCVLTCASQVTTVIGERPLYEQLADGLAQQNPRKEKNKPACYIEGEFFKDCPR